MELAAASPKYLLGHCPTCNLHNKYYAKSTVNSNHDNLTEINEEKWHLLYFFYDTARFDQIIICGIHDFGFGGVLPSSPERYRRVVLLLAQTHRLSRRGVRH